LKFKDLIQYLQKAKAFVFAAIEDFGMLPVEAQACGTPVIAYGKGGSLETVVEGETGVFFYNQTVESLIEGVKKFESISNSINPKVLRAHAESFSKERFKKEFREFINDKLRKHEQ
jgi:glycosyltransferase involved in cell wall biosynthesis